MTVLVTGAAGFVGSHLAERCLRLGWPVIGIDSFSDFYAEPVKRANVAAAAEDPEYTLIEGDLLDLDLVPLMADVSFVFHLAAQPGVRPSWDSFALYTRMNVDATQRLLQAAREVSVERVVLASSSSVYGDAESFPTCEDVTPRPVSPYGVTKVATEHLANLYWRNFGVPTVCLRYFTVFGPRQRPDMAFNRLIECALTGRPFKVFGDGNQTRDFTYVADVVTATVAAAHCGVRGATYNIGGGSTRTMNSVFETLGELMGTPVGLCYEDRQPGDARDTAANIARARADLGFEPSVEFSAAIAAQLDWQRDLQRVAT